MEVLDALDALNTLDALDLEDALELEAALDPEEGLESGEMSNESESGDALDTSDSLVDNKNPSPRRSGRNKRKAKANSESSSDSDYPATSKDPRRNSKRTKKSDKPQDLRPTRGGTQPTRLVLSDRTAASDNVDKANKFLTRLLNSPLIQFREPAAQSWIATFLRFTKAEHAELKTASPLCAIVKLCYIEEQTESVMDFAHMMRRIQFAVMLRM